MLMRNLTIVILAVGLGGCVRSQPDSATPVASSQHANAGVGDPRAAEAIMSARLLVAAIAAGETTLALVHAESAAPIRYILEWEATRPGFVRALAQRMDTVATRMDMGANQAAISFQTDFRRFQAHCYPPGVGDRLTVLFIHKEHWRVSEISMPPC